MYNQIQSRMQCEMDEDLTAAPKVIQSKSTCYLIKDKMIICYNGHTFQVSRQVQSIDDVDFRKYQDHLANDMKNEPMERIQFECLYGMIQLKNTVAFVFILKTRSVGNINQNNIYKVQEVKIVKLKDIYQPFEKDLTQSFKLMDLYFSKTYDLSLRMQTAFDPQHLPQSQNHANFHHTLNHSQYPFQLMVVFIVGFVKTQTVVLSDNKSVRITLLSRANVNRIGRRWWRRGINDQLDTANEYQTQTIWEVLCNQYHKIYSHVQLRGSFPFFWQQTPCFGIKASIEISQNYRRNQALMKKYMKTLCARYGSVMYLNLVDKVGRERDIGTLFQSYFEDLEIENSDFVWFDYHGEYSSKGSSAFAQLIEQLKEHSFDSFMEVTSQKSIDFIVKRMQEKVVRANCMDCLDRTNVIQSLISRFICLQLQKVVLTSSRINQFPYTFQTDLLEQKFKQLWLLNGNAISQQYSGTFMMKSDFMQNGKRTFGGMLSDFFIGLKRFYLGHFSDYYYQNCIDLHFGKINFEQNCYQFRGSWKKCIFRFLSFSGIILFPLMWRFKRGKMESMSKSFLLQCMGTSCSGLILGGVICKLAAEYLVQKPMSRLEEFL